MGYPTDAQGRSPARRHSLTRRGVPLHAPSSSRRRCPLARRVLPHCRSVRRRPRALGHRHGEDRQRHLAVLLPRRQAHRLRHEPLRPPAGLGRRRRGRLSAARHVARRRGRLGPLVARRRLARLHGRAGRRHERAGLSRPSRRHRHEAPDERRQGDQPTRALVLRRLPSRPRLEPAQRRCDRLLRLRRRRRSAAPRHAEPRYRRLRRRHARQEARPPEPPRQPRRQQPVSRRSRERQGDSTDAAHGPGLLRRRVLEGRPRRLSGDQRRPRPHGVRAAGADGGRRSRQEHDPRRSFGRRALGLPDRRRRHDRGARLERRQPERARDLRSRKRKGDLASEAPGGNRVRPRLLARRQVARDDLHRRGDARGHLGHGRRERRASARSRRARTPASISRASCVRSSCASKRTTGSSSPAGSTNRQPAPRPSRRSSPSTADRKDRNVRSSTPSTRRSFPEASRSSRRTSAGHRASGKNSSTSTTARCASRASRTSRTASTRS